MADDKESLIIKYLPLVKSIVARMDSSNSGLDQDDLVSIGVIGLMDAIEKYDKDKNVPFEAYARIRIRGSIIDELRRQGPVSRNRMEKLNAYYKAKSDLENELLRSPTEKEICKKLEISLQDLLNIHETVHYLSGVSLETLIFSQEGSDTELIDMIPDEHSQNPTDKLEEEELRNILMKSIERLDEREKILLDLYYVEELTMKEIGYILDVSVPRVSQMHGQIVLKLRSLLNSYMEDV